MAEEAAGGARVMASPKGLKEFCTQLLQKLGVPHQEAEVTADTLVSANLRGVDTHGVMRMTYYTAKLRSGVIKPKVDLTPIRETIATALLDGHDGIGQVISHRAMQIAIRKAKEAGIAYVSVRNSNHLGACAYYSMMALPHDMIGFVFTNASPRLAPTGGTERLFGNNPWSIAVPAGRQLPVVLDMANSVVAAGKIRVLQKEGKPIPEGWALDVDGVPTTDPEKALKGILLAIGGYKGYGITLIVDLLTGVLADSAYGPRVKGMEAENEVAHIPLLRSAEPLGLRRGGGLQGQDGLLHRGDQGLPQGQGGRHHLPAGRAGVPEGAGATGEGHPSPGQGGRGAAGHRAGVRGADRAVTWADAQTG